MGGWGSGDDCDCDGNGVCSSRDRGGDPAYTELAKKRRSPPRGSASCADVYAYLCVFIDVY